MPELTREMILRQQTANYLAQSARSPYASSSASVATPSPPPSLSSACSSPASGSPRNSAPSSGRSSALGNSSTQRPGEERCWIPTLDEVSRADPVGQMRIFQRLAKEAEIDEKKSKSRARGPKQQAVPVRNGVPRPSPLTSTMAPVPKPNGSSVEIGMMALQLVRPSGSRPIEHPTLGASTWGRSNTGGEGPSNFGKEDDALFSEWVVGMPDSPATSSWDANRSGPSEEEIARWAQEDAEMNRRMQEQPAWAYGFDA